MAAFIFGEKIDFNIVPNPDTGGFVIGYDLDGVLKQKDEFGVITNIGGGSGNLSSVLAQGNNSGTYSIVLDNGSYITNNTSTNKINLNNSAISLTTDNELYIESYLYLTATDAILANGSSSFRIEGNAVKLIYDANNNQIITNNSYKLRVNNSNVLEFGYGGLTAGPGSRANAIISSDGSIINTNLINTVVIGGSNITASQSNSVYVPSLYVQDSKFIRGTNGSVFMSGKSVIGIQESTSTILTNNGILLKDTATQSTSPNLDSGITYISSKNSRNSAGIKNTVVVGGTNINATASDTVYLGNKVNINNVYTLPTTDGSPGQIIKTDGSGNLTWGTQDSGAAIALNYVQFRADYENNILAKNATYLITDADKSLYDSVNGTSIYLSTDGYGNVLESVYGKFWNPKYDKNITGYGIFDQSTTYNQNDIAIWGGYYWTRITPTPGVDTVVDIFNLDSNWVKQPFGNTYYNLSYDSIIYDIDNNKIVSRSDNNNNTVITSNENIYYWINTMSLNNPIKAFQWGNSYDGANGISGNIIVDSYNENINFIGLFQTDMNFVNKSYQSNIVFGPSASQSNFLFSNSSYQNNIVFSGASSQINITLNNNSSQENLDDVSNSYTQDGLSLNNFNSDRTSIPLSDNESFTAIGNDVVIDGNLRVTGTTSTINSINLTIQDPLILLAASQSGAPTLDSGLIIERGSLDNTAFIWDESNDEFVFISTNDDATVSGDVNIIGYENLRANSYIVDGGLSTEFLKADGSLDPTTYAVDSTVVHKGGYEGTGQDLKDDIDAIALIGLKGQILKIKNENTNQYETSELLLQGKYISNDIELEDAKSSIISQEEIFNTWRRYSHGDATLIPTSAINSNLIPGTPLHTNSWIYNNTLSRIESTINSGDVIGFISNSLVKEYSQSATLGANNADNDRIGFCLFYEDLNDLVDNNAYGLNPADFSWDIDTTSLTIPNQHTLSFIRNRDQLTNTFYVVYDNFKIGSQIIANGSGSGVWNTINNWNFGGINTVDISVTRLENVITFLTSNFSDAPGGKGGLDFSLTIDLDSMPILEKFKGLCRYGFIAQSQANAYFENIVSTEDANVIFDMRNGDVWTLNNSGDYVINIDRNLYEEQNRALVYNNDTGKLFYIKDNVFVLITNIETLQTVTGRGATTTYDITANSFIKTGGVSTQFLKANGSVDNTTYAIDSNVVHLNGTETITGQKTFVPVVNTQAINIIIPASTSSPDGVRISLNGTTSGSGYVGGVSVGGTGSKNIGFASSFNSSGNVGFYYYKLTDSGNNLAFDIRREAGFVSTFNISDTGVLNATSIVKIGGLTTQFLKADGSVDSTTYAVDGNVVHKTGNETILGDKIFSNSAGTTGVTFQNNVDYGGNYAIEGYCFAGGQGVARFTHNGGASSTYNLDLRNNSGGTNLKLSTGGSTSGLAIVSENNSHVSTFSLDINGNVTGNSFVKTGGTSAQFLKANGTVDSNVYLTTLTDTLQTVTTRGATTTTSITANSFIKTGGNSTQYLMADGSVSGAITFTETDTLQSVTTRGATTTQPITMNPIANVTGLFVDMEAVDNFPTIGVPDAIRSNIRGHNGTSSSLNCGFYATMQGNKCGGLFVENTATISDATNSIAVDVSFKATSTTNTIFRGRKGGSTVFGVTDNGDLTATSISKIGGTAFEHLMADGSTMEISPQVTISASTVYLDDSFHGKIVKVKGVSTIFVPGSLRAGFNCVFRVFTSANALFLGTQSGVIESSGQNLTAGKMATMFKDTDTSFTYVIAGDLT
jgi:hypothetical protein